ncbi:hypothetical protein V3C99_018074 [Haemonchus contortus]
MWLNPSSNHLRCLRINVELRRRGVGSVIVSDFNAKIGPRRTAKELYIGTHGVEWNEQGEGLSEFIMRTHTIHDHIIFNRRFCLTDVAVVPKFCTGSDHRLLRARFFFSVRGERAVKFRQRSSKTSINWDHFAYLASKWEDSVIDNIDEEYNRLVEHLHDSATKAESLQVAKIRPSSKTLELIRQRGIAQATGGSERKKSSSHERSRRGRKEHSKSPTELRQLQDQDDLPLSS